MDDAAFFDALFRRHHDAVLRYVVRRVDAHRAPDVVSEVFLVARRRQAEEPVDRLPWLLAVARRVIANSRRSEERTGALHLRLQQQPPTVGADHATDLADRDRWERALAQLSVDDQEVLALVAWDQLPTAEAAAVLGCTPATFLVRLSRARRRLRAHLADETSPIATSLAVPPPIKKETPSCHAPVEPT